MWNFKKIRVSHKTIIKPIERGGLKVIDIDTQCSAITLTILKKLIEEASENKAWTEMMLWNFNRYRDANQGIHALKKRNIKPLW